MKMENDNNKPLVSIISINYNHADVTCEMLESMRKVTYPNYEIIVVDNASPSDNPSKIKEKYPEIIFIQSENNLGFSGGNNLGIREAKGKYILLLNNDTEVTPGFLEPLVEKLENNIEVGIVSPKIKFSYPPQLLQYCGISPINLFSLRSRGIGFGEADTGQYEIDTEQAYAHGAALMIKREVIEKIGLMADIYFLYYEELDWCYRARKVGFKIYYVHNSLVYHKESISTGGRNSPLRTYYMNRSKLLYMRRHVRKFNLLMALIYQLTVSIPKNITVFILKREFINLLAYSKALGWIVKNWNHKKKIFENPTL